MYSSAFYKPHTAWLLSRYCPFSSPFYPRFLSLLDYFNLFVASVFPSAPVLLSSPQLTRHCEDEQSDDEAISTIKSPYCNISATTPAPTVCPPSRMANLSSFSMATGVISSTSTVTLSPGITISTPLASVTTPVTSVVLM
jgi:hypothetical protein